MYVKQWFSHVVVHQNHLLEHRLLGLTPEFQWVRHEAQESVLVASPHMILALLAQGSCFENH